MQVLLIKYNQNTMVKIYQCLYRVLHWNILVHCQRMILIQLDLILTLSYFSFYFIDIIIVEVIVGLKDLCIFSPESSSQNISSSSSPPCRPKMYVTWSFLCTPDFPPFMTEVLERGDFFAGIVLAACYQIADVRKDIGDNHRLESGGCVSPAQGGVRWGALICGGVGWQAGCGGGKGVQGLR